MKEYKVKIRIKSMSRFLLYHVSAKSKVEAKKKMLDEFKKSIQCKDYDIKVEIITKEQGESTLSQDYCRADTERSNSRWLNGVNTYHGWSE